MNLTRLKRNVGMLIDQPVLCDDQRDRAPHNAPGTNLGHEFVVVRGIQ